MGECKVLKNDKIISNHPEATPDYLTMLTQNGIPVHQLQLKEGCICSLMRNMSVQHGLVKNARLIVLHLHHQFIEIQVINNHMGQLGDIHCIPRIQFEFTPSRASWMIHHYSSLSVFLMLQLSMALKV